MSVPSRRLLCCAGLAVAFLAGTLLSHLGPASGQAPGKGGGWEYRIVQLEFQPGNKPTDPVKADAQVRKLAADGWEYGGLQMNHPGINNPFANFPCSHALFKRAKK